MFKASLLGVIQAKFPKTFKSWDGFQTSIMANDREGLEPIIIVGLYSKPTDELPANLHRAFRINVEEDSIDSGGEELVEEEMKRAYPEVFAKRAAEDLAASIFDQEEGELTDEEKIASNSDEGMFLQQDLEVLNDNENKE